MRTSVNALAICTVSLEFKSRAGHTLNNAAKRLHYLWLTAHHLSRL